jgi:hypothetical protein
MGSGGTIVLAEPTPPSTAANELFSSGHYTDYGVALSADTADVPKNSLDTVELADLSTATDTNVDPQHEIMGSHGTAALHAVDTVL